MWSHKINQTVEWLQVVQKISKMFIISLCPYVSGKSTIIKPSIYITHNKQALEVARLTRMTSVKETALFLSQPLQFSSTMNLFPQIPIINSPVIKSIYIASIVPGISAEHSDLDCLLMMTDFQLFNKEWYICLPLRASGSYLLSAFCISCDQLKKIAGSALS